MDMDLIENLFLYKVSRTKVSQTNIKRNKHVKWLIMTMFLTTLRFELV